MSGRRILFVGASGYIGGSVLDRFLKSADVKIRSASYSALIRREDQAAKLKEHNVTPILFTSLDEYDFLRQRAAEHDIVVNSADAFNTKAAEALIHGLGDGQKQSGIEAIYLHTSGTSSVGDYPLTETPQRPVLSDKDDVYGELVRREAVRPYAQRTTDVAVVDAGVSAGVKTYILMSPTIYGTGSGPFNRMTNQVPGFTKRALRRGKAAVLSTGKGSWDHIHIDDLSDLYELILSRLLAQEAVPSGKQGIYFTENGNHVWNEVAEKVAAIGVELGALSTNEVESVTIEKWLTLVGGKLTPPNIQANELGFGSWSRTSSDLGRSLGWKAKNGDKEWQDHFLEVFKAIQADEK